jgi:DNA repair protein RadC
MKDVQEKLISLGPKALSDQELLANMLNCKCLKNKSDKLSAEVLSILDIKNGTLKIEDLLTISGVEASEAASICASMEFARRRIRPEGSKISSASDVYPLVQHLADRKQEHFISISLNGAHEVIAVRIITIGLLNSCQIHPREVFADAICDRAAAIIVAHNHPSGKLEPSKEDLEITFRLKEAGNILGIKLLDHIIFSKTEYKSLKDSGLI